MGDGHGHVRGRGRVLVRPERLLHVLAAATAAAAASVASCL